MDNEGCTAEVLAQRDNLDSETQIDPYSQPTAPFLAPADPRRAKGNNARLAFHEFEHFIKLVVQAKPHSKRRPIAP